MWVASLMSDLLFTYGTLQIPEVMEAVTGRSWKWRAAVAIGFAQYLLINEIYPGMVSEKSAVTTGRLYEGLDPEAWKLLDQFEDSVYQRKSIEVVSESQERVVAFAYVLPLHEAHRLTRYPWERNVFVQEHLSRYLSQCRAFHRVMADTHHEK